MFKLRVVIATFVLALTGGIANADTYQIFDLSASGGGYSVSGTITVDQTADVISSFSISTVPATAASFSEVTANLQYTGSEYLLNLQTPIFGTSCSNEPICTILVPVGDDMHIAFNDGGTLSSFTGGSLDSTISDIEISTPSPDASYNAYALTGTLVSSGGAFAGPTYVAPTPLPAALPLFATGLGVMGLLGWRRKRKTTVAQIIGG